MPKTKRRDIPKVGTVFTKKFDGKTYSLKIVNSSSGVAYELNGRVFSTPTAAAKSITHHEVNGWKFWKIDKTRPEAASS